MNKKRIIPILLCFMLFFAVIHVNSLNTLAADEYNLALNKEVSASSSYNTTTFAAKNAVDGNTETRWGNKYNSTEFNRGQGNTEETYTVNLGAVYDVAIVSIQWEAAYATSYTIQGSLDGTTFFDIKDVLAGEGGTEAFNDFGTVETQYIRLALHTCATAYGYSIWELEVYEPTDRSALDAIIEKALTIDEETYTDSSYDALYKAIKNGKELSSAAGQSEINTAVADIQAALDALEVRYPNLALKKTVVASSTHSSKSVSWLVDGSTSKTWQINYISGTDYNLGNGDQTEEVTIDLGAVYPVDMINIVWKNGTFAKAVKIEGSFDNENFFTIKEITDNNITYDKQLQSLNHLGEVKTQYVRFSFSDPNNVKYGYEVYEIEVFEKDPAPSVFTNIALNKNVIDDPSEYADAFAKEYLTDGNLSTRWGNAYGGSAYKADPTETFTIDLEDTYALDRVILNFEDAYATSVAIQGSLDGNEYFDITNGTVEHSGETGFVDLNAVTRYLRIVLTDPVGKYGYSIWEVQAYGSRQAELESFLNQLVSKFEGVEVGDEKGAMPLSAYQTYSDIIDNAEALLADENSSYGEMRNAMLSIQGALETIDADIITSDVTVSVYPTVQTIRYGDDEGMQIIGDTIDIVVHGEQDAATLPKLTALLESEGYTCNVVDKIGTNPAVILAVDCGEDCEICDSVNDLADALEHTQGYVLNLSNDVNANGQITIIGADEDGAYYGVMSLMQIFEQKTAEGVLTEVTISDYPDTEFRGYVEGFYGYPWTTEERASLFEDTSKYKMTTYIYAPKNDPYHRTAWRTLYPAEEAKDVSDLAQVAAENNMDFCWTIHPGADYDYTTDSDGDGIVDDFATIIAKFDQVYSLGVRQFGIFYDDLDSSKMDGPAHAQLLNDVYDYMTTKYDDVKPFITVTSRYNNAWGGDWKTYFTPFMEQVHEDTIVLWTGQHTMSAITKDYMEVPQTKTGVDRDLGVWWNYPVTDYCYGKMLMGSLDILSRDVDNINSFFLNPMSEADASKVAIFSGADYSWNIGAFESESSWERAIEELVGTENGANEAFERFADNISYISLPARKSGFEFEESKYLAEDLENFNTALACGENIAEEAANLKVKFEQMISDVETIRNHAKNENLLSEVELHLQAYESMAKAGVAAMEGYLAAVDGNVEETMVQLVSLEENLAASGSVIMDTMRGDATVIVGSYKLQPLLKESCTGILDILHVNMDYPETQERMITNIEGLAVKQVEKEGVTYSLSDITTVMNANEYIAIALPEAMNIYKISAEVSPAENFKLQYSLNGLVWEDAQFEAEEGILSTDDILTGAYVRLVCTEDNTEASITKFSVTKAYEPVSVKATTDLVTYQNYFLNYAIDGSMETYFWSSSYAADGNYICVDLGALSVLNKIEVYHGMNKGAVEGFAEMSLEISKDGVFWSQIGNVQTTDDYIDVDDTMKKLVFDANGEEARYFRFTASGTSETWTKVFEIAYEAEYVDYENHLTLETNMPVCTEEGTEKYTVDQAMDNRLSTSFRSDRAAEAGDYVSVDLGTLVPLYDASIYMDAAEAFANVKLQTSTDGEVWEDASEYMAMAEYVTEGENYVASFGTEGNLVRYLRFLTGEAGANNVSVCEIKYNQTAESVANVPALSTNLTAYKGLYPIDLAMDGDLETKFYSSAPQVTGDYVQIDLGSTTSVNDYSIWFAANPRVAGVSDGFKEFQVQVSFDGTTWSDIGDKVSSDAYVLDNGKYLYTGNLGGVLARYIRFTAAADYSSWLQIYEIEINESLDYSGLRYVDNASLATVNNTNLIDDKNITTYTSLYHVENGEELVYPMNVSRDVLEIGILQDIHNISNAAVSVQSLDGNWTEIGTLDQAWNKFDVNQSILAVKLTFDGDVSTDIYEILVYGGADYIKVEEALEKVPTDLGDYTDESVQNLENVIAAVVRVKESSEQAVVDGYAKAIQEAILALEYKTADYTAVDAAIAKVPENLSVYTTETVKAVEDAVAAVVRGKNITEQVEVDAMAQAIEEAVAALEVKPADYTVIEKAIAKVPTDLSLYTDETVKAVRAAVVAALLFDDDKLATEQSEVDAMAKAIDDAVAALQYKDADYTLVDRAVAAIPTDLSVYTDETVKVVEDAVAAVEEGKKISEQKTVDAWAEAIVAAVQGLQYKAAAYDAVNEAIAKVPTDLTIYTKESVDALNAAVAAVENDKDITDQATVDAWAQAILDAIDALEVKDADYTLVDNALASVPTDLSIYTEKSVKEVNSAVAAVVEGKKVTEQSEVDAMAQAIEDAVAALELKDADYTAVEAALAKVPEDLSIYTKGTAKAVTNAVAAVVEGLKITEQAEVDAMAQAIEDALAALELKSTLSGVIRVAGENRYETGFKVADVYKETLGVEKFQTALVATGKNFADALPGSYLAYVKQAPILLTNEKEQYMDSVVAYITENVEAGAEVYILGGTVVVPAEMDEKLEAAGYNPVRLAGENRYETNVKILEAAGVTGGEIIVATGRDFADSLSASSVGKPILLVKDQLNDLQKEYLTTLEGSGFYIVGGEAAVGKEVEKELGAYGTVLDRLAGRNRRETSVLIAQQFFGNPTAAVTAYAGNFPDGLCGGPLAAELNVPLILTVDGKTTEAADYMAAKNIELGYVLGGEKVLADETVETVFGLESTDEIIVK